MTDEQIKTLAFAHFDVDVDSRGREEFSCDDHGLIAFARRLLADPRGHGVGRQSVPCRSGEGEAMNDRPYTLTPLGLLSIDIGELQARRAVDAIEAHLRRHYGTPSAVVWDGERLTFSRLAKDAEARG